MARGPKRRAGRAQKIRLMTTKHSTSRILGSNWGKLRALLRSRRKSGPPVTDAEREALELIRAAIVYARDGLHCFPDNRLHKLWRPLRKKLPPPEFGSRLGVPRAALAQMHLASAGFRLPVALQKTIEAHPPAAKSFGDLWGRGPKGLLDWRRPKMWSGFPNVKALACCRSGPLGSTDDEKLQHAITIVMVLRDDFGHGEEGDPSLGDYMRDREGVLNRLYTCRIVEAQTVLVAWASAQFR